MEERCITDHVHIRMLCTVFTQTLHGILMCFRLSDIKCNLMFKILPAICHSIVHMNRIPDNICQKADCIFMERFCIVDADTPGFLIVFPLYLVDTTSPVERSMTSHQRFLSSLVLTCINSSEIPFIRGICSSLSTAV